MIDAEYDQGSVEKRSSDSYADNLTETDISDLENKKDPPSFENLKGVLCEELEGTIGMIVAPEVTFTDEAIDCAQYTDKSKQNILLHLTLDSF
ncbi:25157_t:CDS:2 [Gigaspora rosea]|nr:25157_t:CDS:2 [Gigaspora rosea]